MVISRPVWFCFCVTDHCFLDLRRLWYSPDSALIEDHVFITLLFLLWWQETLDFIISSWVNLMLWPWYWVDFNNTPCGTLFHYCGCCNFASPFYLFDVPMVLTIFGVSALCCCEFRLYHWFLLWIWFLMLVWTASGYCIQWFEKDVAQSGPMRMIFLGHDPPNDPLGARPAPDLSPNLDRKSVV